MKLHLKFRTFYCFQLIHCEISQNFKQPRYHASTAETRSDLSPPNYETYFLTDSWSELLFISYFMYIGFLFLVFIYIIHMYDQVREIRTHYMKNFAIKKGR